VKEGSLIEVVSTADTRQSSKAAYEGGEGSESLPKGNKPGSEKPYCRPLEGLQDLPD
jgi:hypothetical protein